VDENTGCASLAMDPQEPDILYAGMWQFRRYPDKFHSGGMGSGLYKSTDAGKNWKKITAGLPDSALGRITVAVAPSRPNVVYAVVEAKKTALYRSDDLGENWQEMNHSFTVTARPFYFGHLVVDPHDYNRVYKPSMALGVSTDGGKSFSDPFSSGGFGGGGVHSDHHALWIDPNDTKHLLLGTDGGVYETRDRGQTWHFFKNLPVSQFYRVSYDMARPYNVYGGLQDNGSWSGPSSSPGGIENRDWENLGGGDGFYVFPDPSDDDIIYLESQGGNIIRKHLSTLEVKRIKPYPKEGEEKYRFNWNTPIAFSPTNPNIMYLGSQYLLRSEDKGDSWQTISPDLTTDDPEKQKQNESGGLTIDNSSAENHCTIYAISESPKDANVVWVGTDDGNLQVTENGGTSWQNVVKNIPNLPPNTWVSSIEASHFGRATAYATFDGHRHGDKKSHVYKTTDLGRSWQSLATVSVAGYALDIKEDPVNPNLLFLGTEFGLYVSVDGGQQWARFTGNLPKVGIREIAIHPREADVILATHGRGIMIIDDITPLRQITPEVLASQVFILKSRPSTLSIPAGVQQFNANDQFVGKNPSEVATITYYLKKRHIFGDMKIEIYDPEGNLVKTLPGGKRRGINRVDWTMRKRPPRVPRAATLAFGALFGPMADAGIYTIKLIKEDRTYSGELEIIHDPKYSHSVADRNLQQQTVMKLYNMQEHLAYIAEATTSARDQAKKLAEGRKKGDRLAKNLSAFAEKLDTFHKTLAASRRGGFLTGEEQLREKISNLYASVSGYAGKPTQSELDRTQTLADELKKADVAFNKLMNGDLKAVNEKLAKKNLEPIKIMTEKAFREG
jgi:photosystem II stability/assembly factor-like uncharacterized protein